jgi:hypothetical protein
MTDTALFSSVYGFALLLVGLALTAYEFNRIRRQRRQRIRVQMRQAPHGGGYRRPTSHER